jgi:VWFA-related protein
VGTLTESTLPTPGDGWSLMRSSPEAKRPGTAADMARSLFCVRNLFPCFLLCVISFLVGLPLSVAQDASQQTPAPSPAPQSESKQNSAELASHDEPAAFKVNVKLVVVRAVVRDSQGHAIGNLHQEDFQVFDKGKPQVITQFEVEQPGALAAKARQRSEENSGDALSGETPSNAANAVAAPERFVAYLFDDVHLEFGDLARAREAAKRNFATLRPTDRAAIFTTSGVTNLDFTDDHAQLLATLLRLQPRPIGRSLGHDCPDVSYYQADLIANKNDSQAMQAAIQDALVCNPPPPNTTAAVAAAIAQALVQASTASALSAGEHESRISLGLLREVVNGVSRKPGQRSVVLVSPGFITPQLEYEYTAIIDQAVRAQVVINTLDARGLYVPYPFADPSIVIPPSPLKPLIEGAAASANDDLLAVLADSTGGVFFHNNNDLDEGFRRVAEAPEYSYVLAFAPQNLKLDGTFHSLKVTLKNPQKLALQARRGYYAPKSFANPEEQAKQEITDEIFSQEELHNLPVNLHTQFFKASDQDAKLVVLAHVDVKRLHFRRADGRNNNVLTCAFALFNRNGSLVQGTQTIATMHLKDETLERKKDTGITLKTSFDVKPGSYLVRLVVRDAEGQLMSAENGTVEIR